MYIVTEVQLLDGGQVATITVAFENRREATAKYHQILASASLSGIPCHTALMYTEEGYVIQSDFFRTEPEEPEEETPQEEEQEVPAEEEQEEEPEEDYHDPEPSLQDETIGEPEDDTIVPEEESEDDNH